MAKMVTYNGGTETYLGCSDPSYLEKGKKYEVISEEQRDFQTNYKLRGVNGYFNSVWFDEIKVASYLAIAHDIPKRGECIKNFIRINEGKQEVVVNSSTIVSVKNIVNNIFEVHTKNTIYIVQVI